MSMHSRAAVQIGSVGDVVLVLGLTTMLVVVLGGVGVVVAVVLTGAGNDVLVEVLVGPGDDVLVEVLVGTGDDVLVVVLSPEGTVLVVVVDSGATLVLVVVGLMVVVVAPAGATPRKTGPTVGTSPHARSFPTDTVTSVKGWPICVA